MTHIERQAERRKVPYFSDRRQSLDVMKGALKCLENAKYDIKIVNAQREALRSL